MAQNTSRLQQSSDLKTLRLFLPPGDRVGEHALDTYTEGNHDFPWHHRSTR